MGFNTQAINTFGRLVMPVTNWGASPKGSQRIQRSGKNNHGTSTIFFRTIHKAGRIASLFAMILVVAWSALHANVAHAAPIDIPGKVYWNAGNANLFGTPEEACASPTTGFDPAYWALDRVEPYEPNAVAPELYRCWYPMGNRTNEQVKDPSGTLARQTTRVYDALNRLQTVTGAIQ